jgi:predicted 3-demethylubiquinone-9 3-methyltransferase (glyoxalase superfamily)
MNAYPDETQPTEPNINSMKPVTPCLWFAGDAEAAANFYVSLLPNSRIDAVFRSPADTPSGPVGSVLTVEFTLNDSPFLALNGDEAVEYNHAVSFQIHTRDQAETDRVWSAILANGGKEVQCGWITDRWGLSWQIVPERLTELLKDPDPARARRAMETMMNMVKIDIAALEKAAG